MKSSLLPVLLLLSALPACSGQGDALSRGRFTDSSGGTVALGITANGPYRVAPGPLTASLRGRVSGAELRPDSIVAVARDQGVCGDSAVAAQTDGRDSGIANALVWVAGVTSGKPPSQLRRETLTIEGCRFEPRVVGISVGTTLNVFSNDGATHDIRFYREGGAQPIATARTVDAGQVVPLEAIGAEPGIVEARCTRHPWARAFIAVFDHPYFAVTDESGAFTLDSLEPGTYTIKMWQERADSPKALRAVLGAGATTRADLTLGVQAEPATR